MLRPDLTWPLQTLALVEQPHLIVLLDLEPAIAVRRLQARAEQPHQTDEDLDLLTAARESYLQLAGRRDDVVVIAADGTEDEVSTAVREAVRERLGW